MSFKYRDGLRRNYALREYWIRVNIEDLSSFDESLADKLYKSPQEYLPIFEEAATEVADEVTAPRAEGEEKVEKIQVTLQSEGNPTSIRDLSSEHVSKLVKIPGIVVAASGMYDNLYLSLFLANSPNRWTVKVIPVGSLHLFVFKYG